MKIKISKDAYNTYIQDNTYKGDFFGSDYLEQIIKKISGKTVEVDTEELFKYEFNIKPIEGIMDEEVRIPLEYVDEIIDDARVGKARCELCNRTNDNLEVCSNCSRVDYLEPLLDEDDW